MKSFDGDGASSGSDCLGSGCGARGGVSWYDGLGGTANGNGVGHGVSWFAQHDGDGWGLADNGRASGDGYGGEANEG